MEFTQTLLFWFQHVTPRVIRVTAPGCQAVPHVTLQPTGNFTVSLLLPVYVKMVTSTTAALVPVRSV